MKKFLDILLIVLLTMLVVNLFSSQEQKLLNNTVSFEFADNSYTVPASVWVNVSNKTNENIVFNTCNDIKISNSWENILLTEEFCKNITLESWETQLVDYASEYKSFTNTGKYNLKVNYQEKEYFDQIEIENSWSFKKIFVGLFYAPIYNLMIWLLEFFSWSFGWAIVFITIIIRLVLLYPQHKMMLSQKKLQAVQPKVKKIQEEFKWNQQMLWMKLMELYKKEKVNPMWSCWFLLIQMPILLVIYNIILSIKDTSNFFYTYWFLSDFNLASIEYNFFWLELLESWWIAWVILALVVASVQFLQIKLSLADKLDTNKKWIVLEKKKWQTWYNSMMPDPEMMNKFMLYWMPSMVAIFTYVLFAGVWIYWWISTLFMLLQQLVVNKVMKK